MDTVNRKTKTTTWVVAILSIATMVGCGDTELMIGKYRFLSPRDVISAPEHSRVGWIIPGLGDADIDPASELLSNATRPGPEDWEYHEKDYVIGVTDILDIIIQDVYAVGLETSLRREVADSGYVDLPQLSKRIKADGLTAMELISEIEKAYITDGILSDPDIAVIVAARRQQTFGISGAVMRVGTYNITKPNMRLIDALTLAGGISQMDIETIFIIRQERAIKIPHVEKDTKVLDPKVPTLTPESTQAPVKSDKKPEPKSETSVPAIPTTVKQQRTDLEDLLGDAFAVPDEKTPEKPAPDNEKVNPSVIHYSEIGATGKPSVSPSSEKPKPPVYEYRDGVWQKVSVKESPPDKVKIPLISSPDTTPAHTERSGANKSQKISKSTPKPELIISEDDPYGWGSLEKKELVRVIAINLNSLQRGDWNQNIVIREGDVIRVPPLPVGEFYVYGEVQRPGVYSLTGRKITIKMAMAASGNLGPLAWPENSILVRRIGRNQEQTFPINLERIFKGQDADVFLKPNDVLFVGTHWKSSFLAVLRNAFRMTYGFGFIYDRNFSDPLFVTPNSKRFLAL